MSTILKGNLKKLGEKGPRKAWKKRFFIQRGNKLYYYVSEKSAQEKGFINLDEALAIEKSEKPTHGFQIRTPRRIYYLQAENQEQVDYWINGASKCLPKPNNDNKHDSQLPVEIEQAESRISDLETQNTKLKNVIEYLATQLNCSYDDILHSFELGNPIKKGSSDNIIMKEVKDEDRNLEENKEVKEHEEKEHKKDDHHEEHHEKKDEHEKKDDEKKADEHHEEKKDEHHEEKKVEENHEKKADEHHEEKKDEDHHEDHHEKKDEHHEEKKVEEHHENKADEHHEKKGDEHHEEKKDEEHHEKKDEHHEEKKVEEHHEKKAEEHHEKKADEHHEEKKDEEHHEKKVDEHHEEKKEDHHEKKAEEHHEKKADEHHEEKKDHHEEKKDDDEEMKPPVIIVTESTNTKGNEEDGDSSDSGSDSENEEEVPSGPHFGAQVLFEYSARKNYELSISANEVITVLSKHENGWWLGCNSKGVQGYFPGSYVRPIE